MSEGKFLCKDLAAFILSVSVSLPVFVSLFVLLSMPGAFDGKGYVIIAA